MSKHESMSSLPSVKTTKRQSGYLDSVPVYPVLIEKTARAISDWRSELDWPVHTDQAVRSIEAIAEVLQREGFMDASQYLRSIIHIEPQPRNQAL